MTTDNPVMNTASPTELHALPTGELVRRLIDAASDTTNRPYLDGLILAAAGRLNGQGRVLSRTIGALWEEAEANAYRDWQTNAARITEREQRIRREVEAAAAEFEAGLLLLTGGPERYAVFRRRIAAAFESLEL